jgi:hypothetical protein
MIQSYSHIKLVLGQIVSGNMSNIYVRSYLWAHALNYARFNPTLVFSISACTARD